MKKYWSIILSLLLGLTFCFAACSNGETVTVTGVTVAPSTLSLEVGETGDLTATVAYSDGATNSNVTWSSDNEAVATVSNGKVTAVAAGKATIRAASAVNGDIYGTCAVTVTQPAPPVVTADRIALDKTELSLGLGEEETLTATVTYSDGTTDSDVTWSSDDEDVAIVEDGKVTAVARGEAIVTAASAENPALKATCRVTVINRENFVCDLSREQVLMYIGGGTSQLTASVLYDGGVSEAPESTQWSSSDAKIVSVENGTLTPVGEGTATVRATIEANGKEAFAECSVKVVASVDAIVAVREEVKEVDISQSGDPDEMHSYLVYTPKNLENNENIVYTVAADRTGNTHWYIKTAIVADYINNAPVTEIDANGFMSCGRMTDFTLGKNIVRINNRAFSYTHAMKGASIELNPNTELVEYSFAESRFGKITIAEGTTEIPAYCFQSTPYLEEVVLPRSLTTIGSYAFAGCSVLETVDLTNTSLVSIGVEPTSTGLIGNAFYYCGVLKTVGTLPSTLEEIGFATFLNCNNLVNVQLNAGLKKIGAQAFMQCTRIPTLSVPSSVQTVGAEAFDMWGADQTLNIAFAENALPSGWNQNWNKGCEAEIVYL